MSRFYQTSGSNPIDWAYQLPYQEMMQGLLAKQGTQDAAVAQAAKIEAMGEDIMYLPKDRQLALEQVDWINKNVDKFSGMDLTDMSNRNKLREFSKEAARRFGHSGVIGNIQKSVSNRNEYVKSIQENKNLSADQKIAAINHYDNAYSGVGDSTPYGGKYNTYSGEMIPDFVNIPKEWLETSVKVKNDSIKEGDSSIEGAYIRDWETYRSSTPAQKLAMVYEGFLQRPDVQSYLRNGLQLNYVNANDWMPGTIKIGENKLEDGTIEDINMSVLNRNLFLSGLNQLENITENTSILKNDSWFNKQADWKREDNMMIDQYSNLYSILKENGYAELDGVKTEALLGDKKVSLKNGIILGNVAGLENKKPEDLKMMKELSDLIESDAGVKDGKFSFKRMLYGMMRGHDFNNETKGWQATPEESIANLNLMKQYAEAKGMDLKELRTKLNELVGGMSSEQKKALVTASMVLNSNYVADVTLDNEAGMRAVDGNGYINVNTAPIPIGQTGLNLRELKHVNKLLSKGDKSPFTIDEEKGTVSINMGVEYQFNDFAHRQFEMVTGGKFDKRNVDKFNQTVEGYAWSEAQQALKNKFDSEKNSSVKTVKKETVDIDGEKVDMYSLIK